MVYFIKYYSLVQYFKWILHSFTGEDPDFAFEPWEIMDKLSMISHALKAKSGSSPEQL